MDFDEVEDYEALLGKSHKYYLEYKVRVFMRLLKEHFIHKKFRKLRILDLGCGTGEAESMIQGVDLLGLDTSKRMIKKAKEKKLECSKFLIGDATELPFKSETFDVVFSFSLLHHIPPEKRADYFKSVRRVLKNSGIVVIAEHNPINPVTRYKFKRCPVDKDAQMLSPRDVLHELKKTGLKVVNKRHIIFLPPLIGTLIYPLERMIEWIPLGGQYIVVGKKG